MKKLCAFSAIVFALSAFAYAADAPKDVKNTDAKNNPAADTRQGKAAEFRKQFQARREQNIAANKALYEQYKAAKTDKEKTAVEAQIKAQAAKQVDEGIAMTKQGISGSEESLNKAKERQAKLENNRDEIIARRVEAIKEGKFGPEAFDRNCENGKCAMPLTGVIGGQAQQTDSKDIKPAGK
ncbi:MAG: hypothetical protein LBI01_02325 [Elusimicrobium sp.]|jgi:opacity protein-like surface antigen|nr:hypothetical protein [Elusimicrobium sp.]